MLNLRGPTITAAERETERERQIEGKRGNYESGEPNLL